VVKKKLRHEVATNARISLKVSKRGRFVGKKNSGMTGGISSACTKKGQESAISCRRVPNGFLKGKALEKKIGLKAAREIGPGKGNHLFVKEANATKGDMKGGKKAKGGGQEHIRELLSLAPRNCLSGVMYRKKEEGGLGGLRRPRWLDLKVSVSCGKPDKKYRGRGLSTGRYRGTDYVFGKQ